MYVCVYMYIYVYVCMLLVFAGLIDTISLLGLFLILSYNATCIVFSSLSLLRVLYVLFVKTYNGHYLVLPLFSAMICRF